MLALAPALPVPLWTAAMKRAGGAPFDVRTLKAYLQAAAPRVQYGEHGVVVAHVWRAGPGTKHTWAFEDTCAWLARIPR